MNQRMQLLVYPVKDAAKTKALFSKLLGVEPYADSSYYVGYRTGDLEVGLDPHGHSNGPLAYWEVTDIRASLKELLDAGGQTDEDVRDVGGGKLIARVKDANGNTLGLMQSP